MNNNNRGLQSANPLQLSMQKGRIHTSYTSYVDVVAIFRATDLKHLLTDFSRKLLYGGLNYCNIFILTTLVDIVPVQWRNNDKPVPRHDLIYYP